MNQKVLNPFIYEQCAVVDAKFPDLPVYLTEQYAQCAEDVIVASILRAAALSRGINITSLQYLEIGGNHPISTSATLLLHRHFGMKGVLIEANPELIDELKRVRTDDKIIHAAITNQNTNFVNLSVSNANELSSLDRGFVLDWQNGKVGERAYIEVPAIRINDIIESEMGGVAPAYMSVDVEGLDLDILRDMDFSKYRPLIVQAEPSDHYLPGNTSKIMSHMSSVGYDLVCKTDVNLIFVDRLANNDLSSEVMRSQLVLSEGLSDVIKITGDLIKRIDAQGEKLIILSELSERLDSKIKLGFLRKLIYSIKKRGHKLLPFIFSKPEHPYLKRHLSKE